MQQSQDGNAIGAPITFGNMFKKGQMTAELLQNCYPLECIDQSKQTTNNNV